MEVSVPELVLELERIEGVEAEQCGGTRATVCRQTSVQDTVLVTFSDESSSVREEVESVYDSYSRSVDLQKEDGWGEDRWAFCVKVSS